MSELAFIFMFTFARDLRAVFARQAAAEWRQEPQQLLAKLAHHGLSVERSGVYGMQPRSSRLLDFGMWWLTHHRERAMWWYNRALMPLGVRFQKKLTLAPGMIDATSVDEILLVCRKQNTRALTAPAH